MRLAIAFAAAGFFVGASHAQEETNANRPPVDEEASQGETLNEEAPPDEELSELERLSRTTADPFENGLQGAARKPISVTLRALDKITARYRDLIIEMHEIVRFGSLEIQPRYCDKRPPEEFPETSAFLEIFDTEFGARESDLKIRETTVVKDEIDARDIDALTVEAASPARTAPATLEERLAANAAERAMEPAPEVLEGPQAEGVNIFRGWMFASSPALNALEHPVYDVWVIDCKTVVTDN